MKIPLAVSFEMELSRYLWIAEWALQHDKYAHLQKDASIVAGRVKMIRDAAKSGDYSQVQWSILYLGREGARLAEIDEKQERKKASSKGGKKGSKKRARKTKTAREFVIQRLRRGVSVQQTTKDLAAEAEKYKVGNPTTGNKENPYLNPKTGKTFPDSTIRYWKKKLQ